VRRILLLAVSSLACGEQAPSEPAEYPGGPFVCEATDSDTLAKSLSPDGTVDKTPATLNLEIGQLAALPGRTTPDAVCVRLQSDLDYVSVQARIKGPGYTSGCQLTELYRIGPAAQPWAVGDIQRFPLDYTDVLAPGLYTQEVRVWWSARGNLNGPLEMSMTHPFEVAATGLQPLSNMEYDAALMSGCYPPGNLSCILMKHPPVPSPPDPCLPPAAYTDIVSGETASETAISRIDVDAWQNVTTIQPLRWRRSIVNEHGAPSRPRLEFQAHDANGAAIHLEIGVATDEPAAFEATGGLLLLTEPHEPRTRGTRWSSSSMRVGVSLDGPTPLRVQLSNVVLEKDRLNDEPRVTRTLDSASIVGEWIQQ
jgi:hypothetical protein